MTVNPQLEQNSLIIQFRETRNRTLELVKNLEKVEQIQSRLN